MAQGALGIWCRETGRQTEATGSVCGHWRGAVGPLGGRRAVSGLRVAPTLRRELGVSARTHSTVLSWTESEVSDLMLEWHRDG